eukprot:m.157648 g.157648  ORF g.157648 m.157648 type:complete len:958 (+) comp15121_c3_seq4:51-2924(+)
MKLYTIFTIWACLWIITTTAQDIISPAERKSCEDAAKAAMLDGSFDRVCPKDCSKDGSDRSLPKCTGGIEYGTNCKTPTCQNALRALSVDKLEDFKKKCERVPDYTFTLAIADLIQYSIPAVAQHCGVPDAIPDLMSNDATCISKTKELEAHLLTVKCPQDCTKKDNDRRRDSSTPFCRDGQEEWGTKCRAPGVQSQCASLLQTLFGELDAYKSACAGKGALPDVLIGFYPQIIPHIGRLCGVTGLTDGKPSCTNSYVFLGELSSENSACPKECKHDEGPTGLRQCNPGEFEWQPKSCGFKKCGDFLSTITGGKLNNLTAGFKMCDHDASDIANGLPNYIANVATQCGHELPSDFPQQQYSCSKALMQFHRLERYCPKYCMEDEDDARENGLQQCKEGEEERSYDTCHIPACEDFLYRTLSKSALSDMQNGLINCGAAWGGPEDFTEVEMYIMRTARQCGYEAPSSLEKKYGACYSGLNFHRKVSEKCPAKCNDDDDDDTGLPRCEEGEEPRDSTTCGNSVCGEFILGMTDSFLNTVVENITTCRDIPSLAQYATPYTKTTLESWIAQVSRGCDVTPPANLKDKVEAIDNCADAQKAFAEIDTKCPKDCSKDDEDIIKCTMDQEEYGNKCKTADCRDFLANVKYYDIIKFMEECGKTAEYKEFAQDGPYYLKNISKMCDAPLTQVDSAIANRPHPSQAGGYINIRHHFGSSCKDMENCVQYAISPDTCVKSPIGELYFDVEFYLFVSSSGEWTLYTDPECIWPMVSTKWQGTYISGKCTAEDTFFLNVTKSQTQLYSSGFRFQSCPIPVTTTTVTTVTTDTTLRDKAIEDDDDSGNETAALLNASTTNKDMSTTHKDITTTNKDASTTNKDLTTTTHNPDHSTTQNSSFAGSKDKKDDTMDIVLPVSIAFGVLFLVLVAATIALIMWRKKGEAQHATFTNPGFENPVYLNTAPDSEI